MMSPSLYVGLRQDSTPVLLEPKALTRGLAIIGQSGCGKSFLLGRLLEEIILNTAESTRIIVIDPNSDFASALLPKPESQFKSLLARSISDLQVSKARAFRNRELSLYHSFTRKTPGGQVFGLREPFNLRWYPIVTNQDQFLSLIRGNNYSPSYAWALYCLKSVVYDSALRSPQSSVNAATELLARLGGYKGSVTHLDDKRLQNLVSHLADLPSVRELTEDIRFQADCGIWRQMDDQTGLPERLFADSRACFIEVECVPEHRARVQLVNALLRHLWNDSVQAIGRCREFQTQGDLPGFNVEKGRLKSTFIVIDEVQDFAPADAQESYLVSMGETLHQLAAEGRKYGLHLILATQRPSKIRKGILGELDNAIIMKMNSRSDLDFVAREMRVLDVKLLEACLHFHGLGNAVAVGEMTGMAPYVELIRSCPRRGIEGDIGRIPL